MLGVWGEEPGRYFTRSLEGFVVVSIRKSVSIPVNKESDLRCHGKHGVVSHSSTKRVQLYETHSAAVCCFVVAWMRIAMLVEERPEQMQSYATKPSCRG